MKNQSFYKKFIHIAWPITLQHLITSSLNLVDTLMIGDLGESAIAAVGVANKIYFFYMVTLFGVYSACGIFASQFWGKAERHNVHRVMGVMLSFAAAIAMLFVTILMVFPEGTMRIFSRDPVVIDYGIRYLRIVVPCYLLTAVSFMFDYTSRSIHLTKYPLFISTIALSINTFLNYTLIYGRFGMPRLGVEGAAIATFIARTFELTAFIVLIYLLIDHPLRASIKDMFSYSRSLVMNIIKKGIPVFVNEMSWALGMLMYVAAFGILGKSALSVVQISNTLVDMFVAVFVGLSSAASVLIGNALGSSSFELAQDYSKRFTKIVIIMAALSMVTMIGLSFIMPNLFDKLESQTSYQLQFTMIVLALYMIPKMYNYMAVVGILRSGGDTTFCMLLDLIGVWLIGIPLAFTVALVFKPPIYILAAIVYIEEIVKAVPAFFRVKQKKWIKNVVDDI